MLLLLHAAGKAEALARSYAELSFRARQMLMAFIVEVVESQAGPCFSTLATTTKLVPCRMLDRQSPRGQDHRLESRMREICKSGSEGGGGVSRSLPLSMRMTLSQRNLL